MGREPDGVVQLWRTDTDLRQIASLSIRPRCMAIIRQASGPQSGALLALAEDTPADRPPKPVTVLAVQADGQYTEVFRMRCEYQCLHMGFFHRDPTNFFTGHQDGMLVCCQLVD